MKFKLKMDQTMTTYLGQYNFGTLEKPPRHAWTTIHESEKNVSTHVSLWLLIRVFYSDQWILLILEHKSRRSILFDKRVLSDSSYFLSNVMSKFW